MMRNKVDKEEFEQYFQEVRTWETDRVKETERSKKIAWRIATISSVITCLAVIAIAILVPLQHVEPFVIRVDNATGSVYVVKPLKDGEDYYNEVINKYFTQWYVRYREGYSRELAHDYYYSVGVMSSPQEQQKYAQFFDPKHSNSPLNLYKDYAKVRIHIKGTTFIRPNIALVRYQKEVERGPDKPQITHWSATITFKYVKAPMSEKDRAINPLGFLVTSYRNDPDEAIH